MLNDWKGDAPEGPALAQSKWHKDGGTRNSVLVIHNYPASRRVIKINFNPTVKFKLHTDSTYTQNSKSY